jgi:predicted ArsR family transcriptional regulator
VPGFKGEVGGPSHIAAQTIKPAANTLREKVLAVVEAGGRLTADEIAKELGKSPFSVRPRVAELHAAGLIERADYRGRNQSGMTASRWRIKGAANG